MIALAGDRIRRLRAIGDTRDPLAVRLALERSLNQGELRHRFLARDSIVCVRRLRVAVAHFGSNKWEEAANRQMNAMLANVSRPYSEVVPANAPAVAFTDTAELLACMARDSLSGDGDSWWWRSIVGAPLSWAVVRHAFSERPTVFPAAVELLAEKGFAIRFVNAMTNEWCVDVCASLAIAFALPALSPPVDAYQTKRFGNAGAIGESTLDLVANVRPIVAKVDGYDDLSDSRRMLLGVALVIRRAPAFARRPAIGAAVMSRPQNVRAHSDRHIDAELTAPGKGHRLPTRDASKSADGSVSDVTNKSAGVSSIDPSLGIHRTRVASRMQSGEAAFAQDESNITVALGPDSVSVVVGDAKLDPRDHDVVIQVDTAFAGVLYLVNIALHLGLYGDFTQPKRPGLSVPLPDFLALVGREACGPGLQHDPLWSLLGTIAGRNTAAGSDDYEPERRYPVGDADMLAALTGVTGPTDDWIEGLVGVLEARAALALGVQDGQALAFLCSRPGRVSLSDERLDAVFTLATHPLTIRLAGLDRNPGWVPAAGRIIQFRYE